MAKGKGEQADHRRETFWRREFCFRRLPRRVKLSAEQCARIKREPLLGIVAGPTPEEEALLHRQAAAQAAGA